MNIIIQTNPPQTLHGLWTQSGDGTVAKDIDALSKKYHAAVGKVADSVLPFFVLSKDYDRESGRFSLFVGGLIPHEGLELFPLPEGLYAQTTVRPKLGFLWGLAIGEAKRNFYTKWLPSSGYAAVNMEYEYHTEKSIGKKPEIEMFFSLRDK
jgi:predicted transcriptional regulator YdeE